MKFGLMFVNSGPFSNPALFEVLVRTADEVGFESLWTVEHVVVPVGYESQYPYSKDGRMPGNNEKIPIPDPIVPLAYAAAITKQIKLGTGILILPQRHPVYVAKEMATLDQLSKGRALLGVGIGWLEEEFQVVGVPFKERAARTEESVRALRSLWSAGPSSFDGEFYRWGPVESQPKPVQKNGVPVIVGGHVEGAARRAARVGDGFFPARGELDLLTRLFAAMRDECGKVGRKPEEIELTTGMGGTDRDSVRRYEDLGVSRLIAFPPAFDADGLRRGLEKFADDLIR
jgi:probable F420-dependent oxidoreductase